MRRVAILLLTALAAAALAFAQPPQTLQCGIPVDVPLNASTNYFFTLSAQPGDAIVVRVLSLSPDRTFKLNPTLTVADPYGNAIPPRQFTGVARPAPVGATLASEFDLGNAGGDYTIRLSSPVDVTNGVRLAFSYLNRPCTGSLTCGAGAQGQIGLPSQVNSYKIDAAAGDIFSVRLLKLPSASGSITPGLNLAMSFYAAGQALTSGPNNLPLTIQTLSANYVEGTITAPVAGPVTILLVDAGGRTGSYAIAIARLNGPCGGATLGCGSVVPSSIATLMGTDSFSLPANPGDVYMVRLARNDASGNFAPVLDVFDATGNLAVSASAQSQSGRPIVTGVFTSRGGMYTLIVRDGLRVNTGGYTVSVTRINRPCLAQGVSCGSVVEDNIGGLLRAKTYSLAAATGDAFLLRLQSTNPNSPFRPRLDVYDPSGSLAQFLYTTDLTRATFTAQSDGAYTLILSDSYDGAQSGSYTFSVARLNRPCDATPLSCAAPAPVAISGSLRFATYSYTAAAGDAFSVRTLNPSGVQPAVAVFDPQGNPAGQAISGNVPGLDIAGATAGSYTVVATDESKTPGQGSFGVELLRTSNACGSSPPLARTVNGVVSGAAPFASYSLPAAAGDSLLIRGASFTPGFGALMELYDPDGVRAVTPTTFSIAAKAAKTGNYTLLVGAAGQQTGGAYALSWQLLNRPAGAVALTCGGTAAAFLTSSTAFRYYSAGGVAGDAMRFLLSRTSDNFAPQMELFDPSGARLAGSVTEISQKVRSGGDYLVLVAPSTANGESGGFSLAFQRPNRPCSVTPLACGQTSLRVVDVPGQVDAYSFNGNASDQVAIRLTRRSGSYAPFAELFDASGALLRATTTGQLVANLPADGPYTVMVRDRAGAGTGSYRIGLQSNFNPCELNDQEPPTVTLLQPTGGEVVVGGAIFHLAWQSDDNAGVTAQDIALSADGGATFPIAVVSGLNGSSQAYDWAVPVDIAPSRSAVIRVTARDAAANSQSALSRQLSVIGSGFTANSAAAYAYDSLNRMTQATLSDGRTVTYTWDANGNLVQVGVAGP